MITLRDITLSDCSLIHQWKSDPYLKKMAIGHDYQSTFEIQRNDIKQAINSEYSEYKIILLDKATPIGYIRIDYMDKTKEFVWIRFALGKERGKGYMLKALNLYTCDLFSRNVVRIEGEAYSFNIPSIEVLKKVGFKQEGVKRNAHFTGTEYTNVLVFGLIKEDL